MSKSCPYCRYVFIRSTQCSKHFFKSNLKHTELKFQHLLKIKLTISCLISSKWAFWKTGSLTKKFRQPSLHAANFGGPKTLGVGRGGGGRQGWGGGRMGGGRQGGRGGVGWCPSPPQKMYANLEVIKYAY